MNTDYIGDDPYGKPRKTLTIFSAENYCGDNINKTNSKAVTLLPTEKTKLWISREKIFKPMAEYFNT